jgi:hypothetical protein
MKQGLKSALTANSLWQCCLQSQINRAAALEGLRRRCQSLPDCKMLRRPVVQARTVSRLGDRACLALAIVRDAVYTTGRPRKKPGIPIHVIR